MSQMMPPPSTSPEKLEGKGNSPFLKWILALIIIGFLIFGTATAYYLLLTQKELNQARKTQEKLEKELTKTKKELKSFKEKLSESKKRLEEISEKELTTSAEKPPREAGAYTPPKGSAERTALLDAARNCINWKQLFIVHSLKVKGSYAYGTLEQLDPSRPEERYESFVAFWRKKGKTWKCLECIGGADLVVLEENTGMSIEEWLQDRYPDSPSEIFE